MRDILVFVGYTFLVLALIFLVLIVMDRVYRKKAAASTPVRATLLSRRTEVGEPPAVGAVRPETIYYAVFLCENGEKRELRITAAQFSDWQEGDSGMLTEADGRVISFPVTNRAE